MIVNMSELDIILTMQSRLLGNSIMLPIVSSDKLRVFAYSVRIIGDCIRIQLQGHYTIVPPQLRHLIIDE